MSHAVRQTEKNWPSLPKYVVFSPTDQWFSRRLEYCVRKKKKHQVSVPMTQDSVPVSL